MTAGSKSSAICFTDSEFERNDEVKDYFLKICDVKYEDIVAYRNNKHMIKQCDIKKANLLVDQAVLRKRMFEPLDQDTEEDYGEPTTKLQRNNQQ